MQFVDHSGRDGYHREILADPSTDPFQPPDPKVLFWVESTAPTQALRIREDLTALLSTPDNGRTYYVGLAGIGKDEVLTFTALASASPSRTASCTLTIAELNTGEVLPGRLVSPH